MNTCQANCSTNSNCQSSNDNIWLAGRSSRSIAFILMYCNLSLVFLYVLITSGGAQIASWATPGAGTSLSGLVSAYFICNILGVILGVTALRSSRTGEPRRFAMGILVTHILFFAAPYVGFLVG